MELVEHLNGSFQPTRYRTQGGEHWLGHLPFAHDLIAAIQPSLLVELGTRDGESYFGFCQSVRQNNIPCSCYAIVTSGSEPHSDFQTDNVYSDLSSYNSAFYSDFSQLLRATSGESLTKFLDNSIDILHVDGLDTYRAVSHDLTQWLAKVKPGGIVLIHDITQRQADFGVWRLWEELASSGQQFSFRHNSGLGVFRKHGRALPSNSFLSLLFDSPTPVTEHVQKFYSLCAIKLQHEHETPPPHCHSETKSMIYVSPFGSAGYTPDTAVYAEIQSGRWNHVSLEILQGTAQGALRIDPAPKPGFVDVSAVKLRRPADGEIMWCAKGQDELSVLSVGGTLIRVDDSRKEFARFFSHGSDSQLFLPLLDTARFDQPLILEIWLRIDTDIASLLPVVKDNAQLRASVATLEAQLAEAQDRQHNSGLLIDERDREKSALVRQRESLTADLRRLQSELYVCRTDLKVCRTDLKGKNAEELSLRSELAHTTNTLNQALASRSWRITKPVRMISEKLSGRR